MILAIYRSSARLPAISASKGQMQAVGKIRCSPATRNSQNEHGLPFAFSVRQTLLFFFLFSGTEFPY
jgi:hypothetical protein